MTTKTPGSDKVHIMQKEKSASGFFDRFSGNIARLTGSSRAFIAALVIVIIWAASGPFFHFSNTWQLIINTGTTVVTFLMVFIIQEAQNKDTLAIQLKLNELIAATKGASNQVLNIEDMTEEELKVLKKFYSKLSELAEKDESIGESHSVEEAMKNELIKQAEG